jgi:hypothetical protein
MIATHVVMASLEPETGLVVGLSLLGPGLPLLIIGLVIGGRRYAFLRQGIRVGGVVADLEGRIPPGRHYMVYAPLLLFTTLAGEVVMTRPYGVGESNPPAFKRGQPVPVAYDPANPRKATIASFADLKWMLIVLMGAGVVLVGLGLVFLLLGLGL